MVTRGDLAWFSGGVNIFLADWAIGSREIFDAPVIPFEVFGQTHVTRWTMEEVLASSDATNTTPITMELLFIFIIEELAFKAEILSKYHSTGLAILSDILARGTRGTNQFLNIFTLKDMLFHLIMAEPAAVRFLATWRVEFAVPLVVITTVMSRGHFSANRFGRMFLRFLGRD